MAARRIVLVDTMVIIHGHTHGIWKQLCSQFQIETVEKCVEETQTGQAGRGVTAIDETTLRSQLKRVHSVTDEQLAEVLLNGGELLHDGEQHLWAHALSRTDEVWVLCGPDRASMKFGHEVGQRDRLISVGELLTESHIKAPNDLPDHLKKRWLEQLKTDLILQT